MVDFEGFYSLEWVQVTTAFVYVVFIMFVPFVFWIVSKKLVGEAKSKYIELSLDIYLTIFFLLISPVGYLVLYFIGSENKFMLNDPLPWVCLVGGTASLFDLIRSNFKLNVAKDKSSNRNRLMIIIAFKNVVKVASFLTLIPLLYGLIMVVVTNMVDTSALSSIIWFITFLITGLSIIYTAASKSILYLSQAYSEDPSLGEK
ncbi:hypothetical protein [Vibrio gigantis]|uniref:hypothetical protein n=1 Tax=Vibrio gigantis TaxID=296199 RepID=UPI001BFE89E4|nr:hypothetical protein [Vibrio gigantis]